MKYLKFEFKDRKDMLEKLSDYFDKEGNPINCAVVELGNVVLTAAKYDEKGNQITAAVYSDKYAVDVLFYGEFPEIKEEVLPEPYGSHIMAGLEGLYVERYNEKTKK